MAPSVRLAVSRRGSLAAGGKKDIPPPAAASVAGGGDQVSDLDHGRSASPIGGEDCLRRLPPAAASVAGGGDQVSDLDHGRSASPVLGGRLPVALIFHCSNKSLGTPSLTRPALLSSKPTRERQPGPKMLMSLGV